MQRYEEFLEYANKKEVFFEVPHKIAEKGRRGGLDIRANRRRGRAGSWENTKNQKNPYPANLMQRYGFVHTCE